jgi:O-antigen/teichoic acid export membrane protein
LVLLLSAVGSVLTGGLAGLEAFKDIAGIQFWQGTLHVLTVGPLVWFWGIRGALVWLIVDAVAVIALSLKSLRCQPFQLGYRLDRRLLRELSVIWRFAVPVTLANLMTGPVLWATAAILANQPGGYVQLGLYNAALQWGTVVLLLPAIFGTVFLPVLSSIPPSQSHRKRLLLTKSFGLCLGCAAIVATIMCIFAKLALRVYGREFMQASSIFIVVMVTSVLSAGNEILYRALLANGRAWWRLLSNGAWGAGLICLSMLFVPRFAGLGLAIATLCATGIHFIIQGIISYQSLRIDTTSN